MKRTDIRRILRRTRKVAGWFDAGAASIFALIDRVQEKNGVTGNLFEIGVHHGKSAIFLGYLVKQNSESLGVCDIFENQEYNLSSSGRGDRDILLENFRDHFSAPDNFLKVYSKSSAELTVDEVTPGCRIFHIDGGHRFEDAINDLHLAASTLHPRGAIVVDDAFHPDWPGVTEAIIHFLSDDAVAFRPLLIAFNKIVIVPSSSVEIYASALGGGEEYLRYIDEPALIPELKTFLGGNVYVVPSWRHKGIQSWMYNRSLLSPGFAKAIFLYRAMKRVVRR